MANPQQHPLDQLPAASGGQFTWVGLVVGGLGGLIIGLLWAWWAEVAQNFVAPMILFPMLIGIGVGITLVGLARIAQIGHRPTIVFSVVLAACMASVAQHYFIYLDVYYWHRPPVVTGQSTVQNLSAAIDLIIPSFCDYIKAQVNRGRPLFFEYRAQGGMVWLTWAIDGLLTIIAAVAVIIPAMSTPYCDRCRSWYRVTRNGKIDLPTAEQLAKLANVVLPEGTRSRRYRLSNCHGGCSPTCCELSWEDAGGRLSIIQYWLDTDGRSQVAAALDGVASETDEEECANDK